jgi:hypothetical protein
MAKTEITRSKSSKDATFVLTTTFKKLRTNPIGELKDLHKALAEVGNKGRMVMYSNELTSSIIDSAVASELVHRFTKTQVKDPKKQLKMMDGERKVREALILLNEGISDMRSIAGMGKKKTKSKTRQFQATDVGEGFQKDALKEKEAEGSIKAANTPVEKKDEKNVAGFSLD